MPALCVSEARGPRGVQRRPAGRSSAAQRLGAPGCGHVLLISRKAIPRYPWAGQGSGTAMAADPP